MSEINTLCANQYYSRMMRQFDKLKMEENSFKYYLSKAFPMHSFNVATYSHRIIPFEVRSWCTPSLMYPDTE